MHDQKRAEWFPSTPEEQRSVEEALEQILGSTPFQGSRRYPRMLRYVVESTLRGEQNSLKERTIGTEVFGRLPGYDTNADPVVRFSAGEIRRRMAQFYQESQTAVSILIELPSGTYVPRFARTSPPALDAAPLLEDKQAQSVHPGLIDDGAASAVQPSSRARPVVLSVVAAVLLVALALTWSLRGRQRTPEPVSEVWSQLLSSQYPVLISAGQPVTENVSPAPADISIEDHILRPEFRVSIATLNATADIVGYLKSNNKPFNIHAANQNVLGDLHNRPVVLVTGNNNKWTVLLLSSLRFRVTHRGALALIEDARNPASEAWSVDFKQPFQHQTTDYAVVARFQSQTTGGPVIVAAGLSSNGTEAAGEFIVSPHALAELQQLAPNHDLSRNFEAVLKVQVVDGNTGGETILATQFW